MFPSHDREGDWEGYIVQKRGDRRYMIPFWQENNYPRMGFTVHIESKMVSWKGYMPRDDADEIFLNGLAY